MGFTWEVIQQLNPRLIFGSIKGFNENSPYANVKAYENVAQAAGDPHQQRVFLMAHRL